MKDYPKTTWQREETVARGLQQLPNEPLVRLALGNAANQRSGARTAGTQETRFDAIRPRKRDGTPSRGFTQGHLQRARVSGQGPERGGKDRAQLIVASVKRTSGQRRDVRQEDDPLPPVPSPGRTA